LFDCSLLIVGIKQNQFQSASLVIVLMVLIAAIVGLLMYVNHLDLIGKTISPLIFLL
jgi:hypothetical protein